VKDCVDTDDDNHGLSDARDPDAIADFVASLPASSFTGRGQQSAFIDPAGDTESRVVRTSS
jgi:hypothetical protein